MKFKQVFSSDLAFFLIILFALVMSAGGHIVQGDEETMFRVTQNLLEGRGLAVSREQLALPAQSHPDFQPAQDETFWTTSAVPGKDGRAYSKYGIGQSLAAIPLYLIGDWWENGFAAENQAWPSGWFSRLWVAMLNPLALTGIAWLMAVFGRTLGFRSSTSRWTAAAFVFTSLAWPYVKTFYPQPAVAFLVLGAVYAAYRWRSTQEARWPWIIGLACGAAILFRLSTVIILPALALYLVFTSPGKNRWRWLVPLSVGVGLALAATGWYNWLRFGSAFETGYEEIAWTNPPLYGVYGLLFSPGKGVLFYAPMLILSMVSGLLFARSHKPEFWLILGLWITYLGFYAPYNFWTGGFNWGPRFLLPVLPLAFLPLGSLLEDRTIRGARLLFGVFFVAGLLIQIPAILVDHSRYLYQRFEESGDVAQAYGETIQKVESSPILRQWPTTLALIRAYAQPGTWQSARESLKILSKNPAAVPNGLVLLYSEFFRRNTLDFWWLNFGLVRSAFEP